MAIYHQEQRLVDDTTRAVIKLTGRFDSQGPHDNVVAIDVSTLAYAKNTNGGVMSGNTDIKPWYRTAVRYVKGTHNIANGFISLMYQGTGGVAQSDIAVLTYGYTNFDLTESYKGALITNKNTAGSTNGDILMTIKGATGNSSYCILVELRKDAQDYDFGANADPYGLRGGFGP